MTSEEHSNDEIKKKPMNLFDKILQKCQQISITEEECKQKRESLLEDEEEEESIDLDREDPLSIVDKICCSNRKQSTATKLKLLTFLSEACMDNPKLYDVVGSSPLVYFVEKLLSNYSKAMDLHFANRMLSENDKSQLVLIIPILKLLTLSANMSIQKIRAIFMYESQMLLNLMEAAVQCSYNTAMTLKKLRNVVLDKNLVGVLFKMEQEEVNGLITNHLGFQVGSVDLKLEGIHVTLYEQTEENINLNIMKNRPPSGETLTGTQVSSEEPDPILDCCENIESAEWSDIAVARVALLKTLFVYTKKDWQHCLTDISNDVKQILQAADINTVHKHHIGALYGFWFSDAELEEQPLSVVPCLRGQVLTLTGDWAMLWIVDVGVLGFVPKAKLHPLSQELVDLPSLISVSLLRGPVCKMDEVFLKSAYKLLCIILETNAQTGKHMLLFYTGKHILHLIEYPETSVRIAVLNLLLCLAKNSRDVVKFLREERYDHTLLGKLEKYGHAYTASMFTDKKAMGEEIEKMLMILLIILEQMEDITSWPENRRASRVIWMYMCDKKCEWRALMEKCLSVLTQTNSRNNQQFHKRFNHNDKTRGVGHHCTENYTSRDMQKNERGWNSHRDYGQRRGRGDYRRNAPNSNSRRWNSYNAGQRAYENYQGPPRYTDEQHSRDTQQGHGDNNAETSGTRKSEDGHGMFMRRMETDGSVALKQDHEAPHHPRLPKLNTLRRPTPNPNRVTATYHSLLELCDNIPPAEDTTQAKEICQVNLEAEVDYVIYGTKANVKWDKTHELILDKKLWEMKEIDLAQKLCGLLNNNVEGSMYFGLKEDSTIEGIWVSRGDKDTFRNGIDRIMNRCLIPEVRVNSYDIIFTPVLQSSNKLMDLAKQSLFIVEIRVRPLVHMVYMVYQNRKCYTRRGTDTVECTVAQKKQDMMDEEERNLEECIQELEAAANNDLATLAKLIKKHIPQL